jgi:hypothetical protein
VINSFLSINMTRNKSDALLLTMRQFTIVNVAGAATIRLPLMAGLRAGGPAPLKRVDPARASLGRYGNPLARLAELALAGR